MESEREITATKNSEQILDGESQGLLPLEKHEKINDNCQENCEIIFVGDPQSTDEDEKDFEEFTKEMARVLELKEDLKNPEKSSNHTSNNNSFLEMNPQIWENKNEQREDSGIFTKNFEKIQKKRNKGKKRNNFIFENHAQLFSGKFEQFEQTGQSETPSFTKTDKSKKFRLKKKNKGNKTLSNENEFKLRIELNTNSPCWEKNFNSRNVYNSNGNGNENLNLTMNSPLSMSTYCSDRRLSGDSTGSGKHYFVYNNNLIHAKDYGMGGNNCMNAQEDCIYANSPGNFYLPNNNNINTNEVFHKKFGKRLDFSNGNGNGSNVHFQATNNKFEPQRPENTKGNKKNHHDDAANRINLENILRGKDKRTTLMIRHIPNKYSLQVFLDDLNVDFKGKFDVFYLPIDYVNNCNLGFAFINFVDSMHILQFYEIFRGKRWRRFNSEKICELAYAKFQGKKELIAHFEKGSVMNFETEEKKPLILPTPFPLPSVEIPLVRINRQF